MIKRALPALALLVAGCANYVPTRQAELSQFVGKSETQLVQTIGLPTQTYQTGDAKFLAYSQQYVDVDPGWGWGWGGWGWGAAFPPSVYSYDCDTTFQLRGDVVQNFSFKGNGCDLIPPLGAGRVGPVLTRAG